MHSVATYYYPVFIFIILGTGFGLVFAALPFFTSHRKPDSEKVSPYECGFEPFTDTRSRFDVRFYLVSILFVIFDLEVAFLFPWAVSFGAVGVFGFGAMLVFLAVLTVGFIYEWRAGALDWE